MLPVADCGVTPSQLPPFKVVAVALKVTPEAEDGRVSCSVCGVGVELPGAEKVSCAGEIVGVTVVPTLSVTGNSMDETTLPAGPPVKLMTITPA